MKNVALNISVVALCVIGAITLGPAHVWAQDIQDAPSVLTVIMPLPDSDQAPNYDDPAVTTEALARRNPSLVSQTDPGDPLIVVLETVDPQQIMPTGPDGQLTDLFLAAGPEGRPQDLPFREMVPNTRPGENTLRPVAGAAGTRGAMMQEFSPDGSVFVPVDFSETIESPLPTDPFTALSPEGDLRLEATTEDGVAAMLLVDGEIRARSLSLGQTRTLLELDNLQLDVTDRVTMGRYGRIITHIRGSSAGLDLGEGAVLDLARGSRIKLFFHDVPATEGIHWGMRAVGNRVEEFTALARAGRITVSLVFEGAIAPSAAVIKYDGQYTYVTVDTPEHDRPVRSQVAFSRSEVPEPMTMTLLALGGAALLRKRR